MRTFFDSSSFAKRYLEESGSAEVEEICFQSSELGLCVLCVPEVLSAMNRRRRETTLSHEDYEIAKSRLLLEIRDAEIVHLTDAVIQTSAVLLEQSPLRAMDALQVACAKQWAAECFVSSDHRQLHAAEAAGLTVRQV